MKQTLNMVSMILCAAALLFAQGARAGEAAAYFGLKAGVMLPDLADLDAAYNAGMLVGYGRGPVAAEAEITTTVLPGDTALSGVQWDITTLALYAVYRSAGAVYVKIKGGVLYEQVNFDAVGISLQGNDSGASLGLGLGFNRGDKGRVEIEYAVIDSDISLISLAYLF